MAVRFAVARRQSGGQVEARARGVARICQSCVVQFYDDLAKAGTVKAPPDKRMKRIERSQLNPSGRRLERVRSRGAPAPDSERSRDARSAWKAFDELKPGSSVDNGVRQPAESHLWRTGFGARAIRVDERISRCSTERDDRSRGAPRPRRSIAGAGPQSIEPVPGRPMKECAGRAGRSLPGWPWRVAYEYVASLR